MQKASRRLPQRPERSNPSPEITSAASRIVALINSRPASPCQAEIEGIIAAALAPAPNGSGRIALIEAAIQRADAAERKLGDVCRGTPDEVPNEEAGRDWQESFCAVRALEAQIPDPPRYFEDIVGRALIAHHFGDRDDGVHLNQATDTDCYEGPAARLVETILRAYRAHAPVAVPQSERSPLRAEVRQVIVEVTQTEALLSGDDDSPRERQVQSRISQGWAKLDALAAELPEVPRTFDDLLILAELAWYWGDQGDHFAAARPDCFVVRVLAGILAMGGGVPWTRR